MQAIQTKYLSPTNTRGSRIVATCDAGKITVPWDYAQGSFGNHQDAAMVLAAKLGWDGTYVGGTLPNADTVAWVLAGDRSYSFVIPPQS